MISELNLSQLFSTGKEAETSKNPTLSTLGWNFDVNGKLGRAKEDCYNRSIQGLLQLTLTERPAKGLLVVFNNTVESCRSRERDFPEKVVKQLPTFEPSTAENGIDLQESE